MKKQLIYGLLLIATLAGCKTTQSVSTFESVLYPNGRQALIRRVDEGSERKFDFYFMEANRLKAIGDFGKSAMYYGEALSADSTCATCYYELANMLYMAGDAKRAEEAAFRAVQLEPDNEWFLLFLSRIFHQNKKTELALSAANYLVEQKPDNFEYLYNLSQMLASAQKFTDAAASLDKIEKILGMNEYLSLEKHTLYVQAKDYRNAEKELQRLIKEYPKELNYRVYLGDFYGQRENMKAAFNEYQRVLAEEPKNGPVHFSLANYYLATNDSLNFKKALKEGFGNNDIALEDKIQRILPFLMNIDDPKNPLDTQDFEDVFDKLKASHKDDARVYVLYGNFLNHKKERKKAAESFEIALLMDEKQEDVWQDFLFLAFGEYSDSLYIEKSLEGVKAFPENAVIHYLTAVGYSQTEEYNNAIEHLNQVLVYNKDNAKLTEQALGSLGDFYHEIGDSQKAYESYDKALALNGNSVVILNNYAYYLSMEGKELDKAEQMISKVIEFEPLNPTYLDTYAWVLFKRGRYFEAVFVAEQALENSEEISGVLYEHYADILYMNGDREKAVEYWQKAVETGDADVSAKLLEKIEKRQYIEDIPALHNAAPQQQ
ncbi:MAG: tetratricopeptide repeat protein [Cytophagaceae bacterium]|jgi:tetratricopeptide (TPR) repeat protein|nr:tetratricopeptide repeat protein [Cytophagaceae bacterium]